MGAVHSTALDPSLVIGLPGMVKVGDRIPFVTFRCRVRDDTIPGSNPFKWKDVTTDNLFKGKRVVLFALPGGQL